MKNIKFIIFILLFVMQMKSQTVIPIYNNDHSIKKDGFYYKDVDNYQNQYVGTWLYINGNTSLKVVFRKIINFHETTFNSDYYEDVLVGEYQYIENGVEKVNSLSNLNVNFTDNSFHNLYSSANSLFSKSIVPVCGECSISEKRLFMNFTENQRIISIPDQANFAMRIIQVNGLPQLKVQFGAVESLSATGNYQVPYQNYTFIKL